MRSEIQVREITEKKPASPHEKNAFGQTPLHLAADWPVGISILLNAGAKIIINERDNTGFLPVAYASFSNCLATVQLLVDADCAVYAERLDVYEPAPSDDVLWDAKLFGSDEIAQYLVQAVAGRRRRLASIACQTLPCAIQKKIDLWPDKVLDATAAQVQNLLKEYQVWIPSALTIPHG